jgi:hypothetical protein
MVPRTGGPRLPPHADAHCRAGPGVHDRPGHLPPDATTGSEVAPGAGGDDRRSPWPPHVRRTLALITTLFENVRRAGIRTEHGVVEIVHGGKPLHPPLWELLGLSPELYDPGPSASIGSGVPVLPPPSTAHTDTTTDPVVAQQPGMTPRGPTAPRCHTAASPVAGLLPLGARTRPYFGFPAPARPLLLLASS